MKTQYRAVVIGGGVVGALVLYHLTTFDWPDAAPNEWAELAAPDIAALQEDTNRQSPQIKAESGQSCGVHMAGGITFASNPDRREWLAPAWAVLQAIGIETSRLVTPDEIAVMPPLPDMTGIKGGLQDVAEGTPDPNRTRVLCGRKVGFTTSGGFGHRVGQGRAMALVHADMAAIGTSAGGHVVGRERQAEVIAPSPHDPNGERMRA